MVSKPHSIFLDQESKLGLFTMALIEGCESVGHSTKGSIPRYRNPAIYVRKDTRQSESLPVMSPATYRY